MALPRGTDLNSVGSNASGGDTLGATTSDLISFYGVTGVAQRAGAAQGAVSTSTITNVSATGIAASAGGAAFAFVSSTQFNTAIDALSMLVPRVSALITLTNELRAALVALGAISGAA